MKSIIETKRFEATFKDAANAQSLNTNGDPLGAKFLIFARNEDKALELIEDEGYDPDDFFYKAFCRSC